MNEYNVKLTMDEIEYLIDVLSETKGYTQFEYGIYKTLNEIVEQNENNK